MRLRVLVAALGILASASCLAQPVGASSAATGWTFEGTLYLWGAAMDGSVRAGELPETTVNASFSDTLKHLEAGLTARLKLLAAHESSASAAAEQADADARPTRRARAKPVRSMNMER